MSRSIVVMDTKALADLQTVAGGTQGVILYDE